MSEWKEERFHTFDGLSLFYRYKKPHNKTKNYILFLHRGHEHSARIMPFADKLNEDDYWCFAFDLRGHGRSDGTTAWAKNFNVWVQDLNSFAGHIQANFGLQTQNSILIANSVGSVTAISWILNYAPNLKGCILGAPAFSIKLYIPFALSFLKLARLFSDKLFVTSYVRSKLLTRNESEAKAYDTDPLITKKIGTNVLVTLFDTTKNCFGRLKDFETPILLLTAEKDFIVNNNYHKTFIDGISSSDKTQVFLPEFRHAIFHEIEQEKVLSPCRQFIEKQFQIIRTNLPAIIPEARPHTVIEHQKLIAKSSLPKEVYYTGYRALLEKVGRYSEGVATGLKYGFDSGVSLDYVYRNQSTGSNALGKIIDKSYLNSVGWKGIRSRKKHMKKALVSVLTQLHESGQTPVILDIASGAGRYLFETQAEMDFPMQLILNDNDENSINLAKKNAEEFNAKNVSFSQYDAFNIQADLSKSTNKTDNKQPNVIIVSGLFELYADNTKVHHAISQLFSLMSENGYLLYTGQPWHPQMELIGRLLNNRHGKRWVMRRRTQREMDALIESTGFTKVDTATDELGIFTVSCAQKQEKI